METIIQPRILKGFRDSFPDQEMKRSALIEKITHVYRLYGFVPIDTPALEYTDILLRKSNGETEKQVFRFTDNGGRDVSMRFDLTVPFARFVAEHRADLYLPFKRYHIAKVWRGEKPQAGRYREFMQCDADTVGTDSAAADFEILSVMRSALYSAGASGITIHINHRGIFSRFLKRLDVLEKAEDILRSVDKIAKAGKDEVTRELECITCSKDKTRLITDYIACTGGFIDTLEKIESMAGGADSDSQRLKDIWDIMKAVGISDTYVLDPSIARGLDYYTGIVYETFLDKLPDIGSVCSGGRYDNLSGLYTKEKIPGVGMSIGLDRLIAALETLEETAAEISCVDVEIFCTNSSLAAHYQKTASKLRENGISAEVFPDAKQMGKQYAMAESKKVAWGILINEEDASAERMTLKNLLTREQFKNITAEEAIEKINSVKSA